MKQAMLIGIALAVLLTAGLQADFKSTFLVDGKDNSSLGYLSDEWDAARRGEIRDRLKGLGDTHIDIYTWSTAKDFPVVNGVGSNWSNELEKLNSEGLAPVIWLRSDDSPEIDALPISEQINYNRNVIRTVDAQASHYVLALEADEYYSVPEVRVLLQDARKRTDKPIAIHLTPGTRGKEAYLEGFDVYYLQTGFGLSEAEFRAEIEYALTLGLPVVVSEYNLNGQSAEARRFGDIACSYPGVVGTGNGRGNAICGSLKEETKVKFVDRYDDELAVFMLALVWLSATYAINMPFKAQFNYIQDDKYEVMFAAPVTETLTAGATVRDDGKFMLFGRWEFGNLSKIFKAKPNTREERK